MKSIIFALFLLTTALVVAAGGDNSGMDRIIFGRGAGFNVPGLELGPGAGFDVPGLGPISGFVKPSVVCREKGPCYMKRLSCPRKCFKSFSRSGKGYRYGGGGGGCTVDCKKKCIAYC